MSAHWLDDITGDESHEDDSLGDFYCPYTNGAKCAILAKGLQPQELCNALECNQLKVLQHSKRRNRAA